MAGTTARRGHLWRPLMWVVGAFVLAGIGAGMVFDDDYDLSLALWQAVVGWPIGAIFLFCPVALASGVRHPPLRLATMAAIALVGVLATVLVAATDDAQAGLAFLLIPALGLLVGLVALVVDHLWTRHERAGSVATLAPLPPPPDGATPVS